MASLQPSFRSSAFALVIGISKFSDSSYSTRGLPQAERDAQDFKILLIETLGWDPEKILCLFGFVSKAEIMSGFRQVIRQMKDAQSQRLFLLYASTHGHPYRTTRDLVETVLLASDTDTTSDLRLVETGITKYALGTYLDTVNAQQKVLISDACFAAGVLSAQALAPHDVYRGLDVAVISAATERAYILPDDGNSAFTSAFLTAVRESTGSFGLGGLAETASEIMNSKLVEHGYPIQAPFIDLKGRPIFIGGKEHEPPVETSLGYPDLLKFANAKLNQLLFERTDAVQLAKYVPRSAVEQGFRTFAVNEADVYSVVGAAGSGKSTVLASLAMESAMEGALSLWISPASVHAELTALQIIERYMAGTGKALTWSEVLEMSQPLVPFVFLDAVNEWTLTEAIVEAKAKEFLNLAKSRQIRIIVSCREEFWDKVGPLFAKPASDDQKKVVHLPDVTLGNFDDAELVFARTVYPAIDLIPDDEIKRKPLLVRMLSDLMATQSSSQPSRALHYLEIFDTYFKAILAATAERMQIDKPLIRLRVHTVMEAMLKNNTSRMLMRQFLDVASESIGVALLDSGLFRRIADEVECESELLHEYLLSRVLPPNPFLDWKSLPKLLSNTWLGAASFRLSGLNNPALIKKTLRKLNELDRFSDGFVMQVLLRLPHPEFYTEEFLELVSHVDSYQIPLFGDSFERLAIVYLSISPETLFEAFKRILVTESYYPWERKRWMNLEKAALRQKLSASGELAKLMVAIIDKSPRVACRILFHTWLADTTPFHDGSSATVSDVGTTLLCFIAGEHSTELLSVTDEWISADPEITYDLVWRMTDVIKTVTRQSPDEALRHAETWYEGSRLGPELALSVAGSIPPHKTASVIEFIRKWLECTNVSVARASSIIAQLANVRSRGSFQFLLECSGKYSELRPGIVKAFTEFFKDFPDETANAIERLAAVPFERMNEDTIRALKDFYRYQLAALPAEAIAFFRRLLEYPYAPHDLQENLAWSFQNCPLSPECSKFVEERLLVEKKGASLERYSYYIKRDRKLIESDLVWLRTWMDSSTPALYGVLGMLMESSIPDSKISEFLVDACKADDHFLEISHNVYSAEATARLTNLAGTLVNDAHFTAIPKDNSAWLHLIGEGMTPDEAAKEVKRCILLEFGFDLK